MNTGKSHGRFLMGLVLSLSTAMILAAPAFCYNEACFQKCNAMFASCSAGCDPVDDPAEKERCVDRCGAQRDQCAGDCQHPARGGNRGGR